MSYTLHAARTRAAQAEARTAIDLLRGAAWEAGRDGRAESPIEDARYHEATAALARLVELALHCEEETS